MTLSIKLHPEITVKSVSYRQFMVRYLRRNLRTVLTRRWPGIRLRGQWDRIDLWHSTKDGAPPPDWEQVARCAADTPGVHAVEQVMARDLSDFTDISREIVALWRERLKNRRFAVSVKRRGHHSFSSRELAAHLGAELLAAQPSAQVDLNTPDDVVRVEVLQQSVRWIHNRWHGIGGYPLGTQQPAMSLFSGGFDSPVAAWQMMRRGVKTHFLYFSFGDAQQDEAVFRMAQRLWMRFGASHRVYFLCVPWQPVADRLSESAENSLRGVLLKRLMLRAASRVAAARNIPALVLGDAIGQVASQSLQNLAVIDRATECLVLRPLVGMDKQSIIAHAETIGTAQAAAGMQEYCGTLARTPSAATRLDTVAAAERDIPASLVDEALRDAQRLPIDGKWRNNRQSVEGISAEALSDLDASACQVIDIRSPQDAEDQPLHLPEPHRVRHIPYFRLLHEAATFDRDRLYILYCHQHRLSRVQAGILRHENGLRARYLRGL